MNMESMRKGTIQNTRNAVCRSTVLLRLWFASKGFAPASTRRSCKTRRHTQRSAGKAMFVLNGTATCEKCSRWTASLRGRESADETSTLSWMRTADETSKWLWKVRISKVQHQQRHGIRKPSLVLAFAININSWSPNCSGDGSEFGV